MEKNQVSWLNYSVSDKAGETISVLKSGARASGGWSDAELTESGRYVRALLRSHCK
jgi:endoglucanase